MSNPFKEALVRAEQALTESYQALVDIGWLVHDPRLTDKEKLERIQERVELALGG